MTFPTAPQPVPDLVTAIAQGAEVRAVWLNGLGGATFCIEDIDDGTGAQFVKVYPEEHAALLSAEAARLVVTARLRQSPDGHYAGTARR